MYRKIYSHANSIRVLMMMMMMYDFYIDLQYCSTDKIPENHSRVKQYSNKQSFFWLLQLNLIPFYTTASVQDSFFCSLLCDARTGSYCNSQWLINACTSSAGRAGHARSVCCDLVDSPMSQKSGDKLKPKSQNAAFTLRATTLHRSSFRKLVNIGSLNTWRENCSIVYYIVKSTSAAVRLLFINNNEGLYADEKQTEVVEYMHEAEALCIVA